MRLISRLAALAALAGCASANGGDATREVLLDAGRPVRTFTLCFAHGLDDHWPHLEHNVARLPDGAFEVRTEPFGKAPLMVNHVRGTPRGIAVMTRVYAAEPALAEWLEAVDEAIEECDAKKIT